MLSLVCGSDFPTHRHRSLSTQRPARRHMIQQFRHSLTLGQCKSTRADRHSGLPSILTIFYILWMLRLACLVDCVEPAWNSTLHAEKSQRSGRPSLGSPPPKESIFKQTRFEDAGATRGTSRSSTISRPRRSKPWQTSVLGMGAPRCWERYKLKSCPCSLRGGTSPRDLL